MSDDERAIREVVALWMRASQAGDTATVLSLMTDDVIFQVPGREPFGKEAFAAAAGGMKDIRMEGSAEIRELRVLGDWAYLRNYITIAITPPGGKTMRARRLHAHHLAQGGRRPMAAGARRQPRGRDQGRRVARGYAISTPFRPADSIARATVPSVFAAATNSPMNESSAASPFFTASAMTLRP
jgi:uncharacterized protein (TIGR02246 family)